MTSSLSRILLGLVLPEKEKQEVTMDSQAFGHRLRILMADKHMGSSELAERSGISRQMVSNYLDNGAIPSLSIACNLAEALGVSVDDLALTPLNKLIK